MITRYSLYKEFVIYKEALGLINRFALDKFSHITQDNVTIDDVNNIEKVLKHNKWQISQSKREDWKRLQNVVR